MVETTKRVGMRHRAKSLEPRPSYVSFNIMRVWFENAYSRPFWGF